jgi:hypothetical protein
MVFNPAVQFAIYGPKGVSNSENETPLQHIIDICHHHPLIFIGAIIISIIFSLTLLVNK